MNQHFELVLIQNNFLFEFEVDSHKHPTLNQIIEAILGVDLQEDVEVQLALPMLIIKLWEELIKNDNKIGLGYEKGVSFHIPN